jgi:hypothetical protein
VWFEHPGHTYGGFVPSFLERGMTYSPQKDENFSKRNLTWIIMRNLFFKTFLGQHLQIRIWVDKNLKRELGRNLEERGWELKRVSQGVCNVKWVVNRAREVCGAFYSPQENLAVGVSKTRTCLGWGLNMSDQPLWKVAWGPNISGPGFRCWGIGLGQTCPGWGPDMSEKCLWNPA